MSEQTVISQAVMRMRALLCVGLAAGTLLICHFSPPLMGGTASGVVLQLPVYVKSWFSRAVPPSNQELKLLPEDTEFINRIYFNPSDARGVKFVFGIVLEGKDSRSIHKPEVCLDGQGWEITHQKDKEIPVKGHGILTVRDLTLQKTVPNSDGTMNVIRGHYVYWFIGRDQVTPSNMGRQLITMRDNVFSSKTHRWAYAHLLALEDPWITSEEVERGLSTDIEVFIQEVSPYMMTAYGAKAGMAGAQSNEGVEVEER